jgi:hypothetical protein
MVRKVIVRAGLVLGAAGFILFLVLGIGAWFARREADRELEVAVEKAHQGAEVAARVIALVREIIARANLSLAMARAESADMAPGGNSDPLVRVALWKAKHDLPNEVERARDAVGVASEAVVVAGAALEVFGERGPPETHLGVKPQNMQAARTQLDAAATDLKNARTVLGIRIPAATPEQLSQVDQALRLATQVTDQSDQALNQAREKVDKLHRQARRWSTGLAVAITGTAAWAALGQVFLVRACWRGMKVK